MQNIQTLQAFLDASGAQYRIYDLGRRVIKINKDLFEKIEHTQAPYPYPLQRHAWFGILFWNPKDKEQHHIWFLKFPLDEQGFLDLPARNDFLRRALEQLGQAIIESKDGKSKNEDRELKDNPWSYTPRQDKMAAFHAKALVELKQPGSQYLHDVLNYLQQPNQFSQWQHIGVQGIADLCARSDTGNVSTLLAKNLTLLPNDVLIPILLGLENETIDHKLTQAIIACATVDGSTTNNVTLLAAIIRAMSGTQDNQTRDAFIYRVLTESTSAALSIEVLVAISGRAWDALLEEKIALAFLEALALSDAGQSGFNHVLTDVLFMPTTGKIIRQAFRSTERSEQLAQTIGSFLSGIH